MAITRTRETPFCVQFISIFSGDCERRYFKTRREANAFKARAEKQRKRMIDRAKQPVQVAKL